MLVKKKIKRAQMIDQIDVHNQWRIQGSGDEIAPQPILAPCLNLGANQIIIGAATPSYNQPFD